MVANFMLKQIIKKTIKRLLKRGFCSIYFEVIKNANVG
jgi:hypothetical protein